MGFRDQIKHAFAVEKPEEIAPTEDQARLIDALSREIARRGMTTPVEILLEAGTPYNYLASQTMHFFRPATSAVLWAFAPFLPKGITAENYQALAEFLEHRGALPYIRQRIEHFEREFVPHEQGNEDRDDAGGHR